MAIAKPALGAALQYAIDKLGGPVIEEDVVANTNTTAAIIMQGDGDRVAAVITNLSSNDVFIAPDPAVSSTFGIMLPASGGSIAMDVTTDFTFPTRVWYGICPAGGPTPLYVLTMKRFALKGDA